jgi:hypothetical protein
MMRFQEYEAARACHAEMGGYLISHQCPREGSGYLVIDNVEAVAWELPDRASDTAWALAGWDDTRLAREA